MASTARARKGAAKETGASREAPDRILDAAQMLVQTRGYNAFSYADVAEVLKVTAASLHYHFPTKAALGMSLISRYEQRFREALANISASSGNAAVKLNRYVEIYAGVLADHRMCMCGMLAAEFETLPEPMQSALDHFFAMNESWLAQLLQDGQRDTSLKLAEDPAEIAQFIVASLEGAMMLARSHASERRFHLAARRLLAGLGI